MSKQLFIKTFGCQMNEHDTEKIAGVLSGMGYSLTDSPDKADMVILNTCSVREKAELKCYSDLGRINELKKSNPDLIIGVGGCVAQQEGIKIVKKAPYVDLVFGTDNIADIPGLLEKRGRKSGDRVSTVRRKNKYLNNAAHPALFSLKRSHPVKASVGIVDGCDKFCTFCVVPFTRGRERSRQPDDICNEVRGLAANGFKEVTLLGQNVDSYGKDLGGSTNLADLLKMINDTEGIERIRFVTSHPADFDDRLIDAISSLPKVCEHVHLPIQSGSDSVLERMKRNYTLNGYKEKIRRLRDAIPGISITTDIITGFPGETEHDFNLTMDLLTEINYDAAFAFQYSKRPYSPARLYNDQIPLALGRERLNKVIELQNSITLSKNQECIGSEFDILIEGGSKRDKGKLTGRTRTYKLVHLTKDAGINPGDIVNVKIVSASPSALTGEID
ncbi:MAG TPA: tRNA (N6-isopentenyl adenosine(37)-C2)-methylthiotransferase MiaB [Nitrospirota bacterium]|nr:tRNA (N6-isopentenyl adenosine(37)-C2)-methylthiotransferase MiaB [Nitrospirota bacterium]